MLTYAKCCHPLPGDPIVGRYFIIENQSRDHWKDVHFEIDERPPAYRRVELGTDGQVDTQLIWVDS